MKYVINKFYAPLNVKNFKQCKFHSEYIGLFVNPGFKGEGDFCGYYSTEYYINTKLIAYTKDKSIVHVCDISLAEVEIFSGMTQNVIKAETDEEAIGIFKDFLLRNRTR